MEHTKTHQNTPQIIGGINKATGIELGKDYTCISLTNETEKCFGKIKKNEKKDAKHICEVLPDKTVQCWGKNTQGQLGNGTNKSSDFPVKVINL